VNPDFKEREDQPVPQVLQDQQDPEDLLEKMDLLDLQDQEAIQAHKDPQDR